jgi:hypothetical protein
MKIERRQKRRDYIRKRQTILRGGIHRLLVEAAEQGGGPLWQRSQQRY